MKDVDDYLKVRHAVRIEGLSERAAARRFGIDPRTVSKMMKFSVPPGYRRKKPPAKPKLDPFIAVIDRILRDDKSRPKKQQHTAKRIFERLRDEYGFTGGITIVKDYVAGWRQRTQEMFVPLAHPPGHAQADFGEAIGIIGGVERKIHFFAFDLPHSDACFVVGYPAETINDALPLRLMKKPGGGEPHRVHLCCRGARAREGRCATWSSRRRCGDRRAGRATGSHSFAAAAIAIGKGGRR